MRPPNNQKRSLYPPGPKCIPADLTAVGPDYQLRAILLLLCVGLFFFIYFGLLALSLFLLYRNWIATPLLSEWSFLRVLLIGVASLMALFLLKGLFLNRRGGRSIQVEIFDDEFPRLFQFLWRLCDELNAPYPRRVMVSFEVNASAAIETTFWGLFRGRRDLHLGLGLVNVLNLTELKAVLAHEFGHFTQGGMKLTALAYRASGLTERMVYGKTMFEERLLRWRIQNPQMAWLTYVLTTLYWIFVGPIIGPLLGIYLLEKALAREMEFHADRMAVSVSGSDAIVHVLKRAVFGDATMLQTLDDLNWAAGRGLFTDNMFLQHSYAAGVLRRRTRDPMLGEPPPLPPDPRQITQVFPPDEEINYPTMWMDHPRNQDREERAKEIYLRTDFDQRSAWVLFGNAADLKARVTYRMYRALFRVRRSVQLTPAEEVQATLNAENNEMTFDPRYHGIYDNRDIDPGNLGQLIAQAEQVPWTREQLITAVDTLYAGTASILADQYRRHLNDALFLGDVANNRVKLKQKQFLFRGSNYHQDDIDRLMKHLRKELNRDRKQLAELDQRVFLVHYQLAVHLGQEWSRELLRRYNFHVEIQKLWNRLQEQREPVGRVLGFLEFSRSGPMDEGTFMEIRAILGIAHAALKECMAKAKNLKIPKLQNMPVGEPLSHYLLSKNLVDGLTVFDDYITSKWMKKFLRQFEEVQGKINRIHFKSLGSLMQYQELLGHECLKAWGVMAEILDEEPVQADVFEIVDEFIPE